MSVTVKELSLPEELLLLALNDRTGRYHCGAWRYALNAAALAELLLVRRIALEADKVVVLSPALAGAKAKALRGTLDKICTGTPLAHRD
jgi:hypothetical protein